MLVYLIGKNWFWIPFIPAKQSLPKEIQYVTREYNVFQLQIYYQTSFNGWNIHEQF